MPWWQILGFDSIEEALSAEAKGEISSGQIREAKGGTKEEQIAEEARSTKRPTAPAAGSSSKHIDDRKKVQDPFYKDPNLGRGNNQTVIVPNPGGGEESTMYVIVQGAGGWYVAKADPAGTYTDATVGAEIDRLNAALKASRESTRNDNDDLKNTFNPPSASDIITRGPTPTPAPKGMSTREEVKLKFPYLDERLIDIYTKAWIDTGDSELALLTMRSDPMMETVYAGITKDDGTLRMTEQEYIVVREFMELELRDYNLNPQVFQEDIVQAISGDVSAQEFADRLNVGYEGIVNNIAQVKEVYLREFNLDLNEESIFGMFISPQLSTKVLENQIRASQILAEAEVAMGGNALTTAVAKSFAKQGLTQDRARQALQSAATRLPGLQTAARFQGREQIGTSEYVQAVALGNSDYQQQLDRITQQLISQSSPTAGAAQTRTGEVKGLIEG